jgi:hypothetical protein
MKEKDKKPTYEPPRARDLSASIVSGQGACQNGDAHHDLCLNGEMPGLVKCGTGSNPP